MNNNLPNILHVYGGMPAGGVKTTLFNILRNQPQNSSHTVLDLNHKGKIKPPADIDNIPFEMQTLDREGIASIDEELSAVRQAIEATNPTVIQAWGDYGNYITVKAADAGIAHAPIIARMSSSRTFEEASMPGSPVPKGILRETARLSPLIKLAIYTSAEVDRIHKGMGFQPQNSTQIYNGVCTDTFTPQSNKQANDNGFVIGHSGRFNPHAKNQFGFIEAAAILSARVKHVNFIMCGDGVDNDNVELQEAIRQKGLSGRVQTLGKRNDMPDVYNLADVWASTSRTEAFPNVVLEAMSCAKVVTATKTGMPELTVADDRLIIPTAKELPAEQAWVEQQAAVWEMLANMPPKERLEIGLSNRDRIVDAFDLTSQVERFYKIYTEISNEGASHHASITINSANSYSIAQAL